MSLPFRIGCLVIERFALFSFSAFIEPLRAANLLSNKRLYALTFLSAKGGRVASSAGIDIDTTHRITASQHFDMIVIFAGADPTSFEDSTTLNWIQHHARNHCPIVGISGGPVIMARAGILDGYRMTVHWEHAEVLHELYPNLLLERSIFVRDRQRITCAGGTAPVDLVHSLLTEHHGPELAQSVNDWFIHTKVRPEISDQRDDEVHRFRTTNPIAVATIKTMENHISDPLPLETLAARRNISTRQLNRIFNREFDQSVIEFYRALRLDKARSLLQHAAVSITDIAFATGFSSSAHFSNSYRKAYGECPSKVREKTNHQL